jgi:hypothetical protein
MTMVVWKYNVKSYLITPDLGNTGGTDPNAQLLNRERCRQVLAAEGRDELELCATGKDRPKIANERKRSAPSQGAWPCDVQSLVAKNLLRASGSLSG